MPRLPRVLFATLALLLPALPARAAPIVLYDPALGTLPQAQPWLTYIAPLGPNATLTTGGAAVDTTNNANLSAGFFNHSLSISFPSFQDIWTPKNTGFPDLDPAQGFRLDFAAWIRDEDHLSTNRAGFSVILLGQNLTGIELGFWKNRIFAQSGPDFLQAEWAAFNTTTGLINYALSIKADNYWLTVNGVDLLTGKTRNYSSASPFPDPYDSPNMLFLGDDTTSAAADFTIGRVTLTPDLASAPLPPTPALLALGLGWLGWRQHRT